MVLRKSKDANVMTIANPSNCSLPELCLPIGLHPSEIDKLNALVSTKRRFKRGECLYRTGDKFDSLYAIRNGFFKTNLLSDDGREQVTGFYMAGEIMGMDGIDSEAYTCDAVALEDSEVCIIPFSKLEQLSREMQTFQHHFHQIMSREIVREHSVIMLLGSMRAEERLAAFLINLSQRFLTRGYSPSEFNLRMTREEIGSYLGLKLETVSRIFSKFQKKGLISTQQKHIAIKNIEGLKNAIGKEISAIKHL